MFRAKPQKTEAMVKPATQMTKRRLRPNLSDTQPIGAVMIAAATM